MVAAIVVGLIAGYLGRLLAPRSGVQGCLPTIAIGVIGSLLGWWLFVDVLEISGSTDALDLAGLPGAVIGTVLVLLVIRAIGTRRGPARR